MNHIFAGEDLVARYLSQTVRVACLIMTMPSNLDSKLKHVRATWARRCNLVVFLTSHDPKNPKPNEPKPHHTHSPNEPPTLEHFEIVEIDQKDSREVLWIKTKAGFKHLYEHHLNDIDWFLKCDDDSYIVLENLRYLLRHVFYSARAIRLSKLTFSLYY